MYKATVVLATPNIEFLSLFISLVSTFLSMLAILRTLHSCNVYCFTKLRRNYIRNRSRRIETIFEETFLRITRCVSLSRRPFLSVTIRARKFRSKLHSLFPFWRIIIKEKFRTKLWNKNFFLWYVLITRFEIVLL